jgi:hypothetical protein
MIWRGGSKKTATSRNDRPREARDLVAVGTCFVLADEPPGERLARL